MHTHAIIDHDLSNAKSLPSEKRGCIYASPLQDLWVLIKSPNYFYSFFKKDSHHPTPNRWLWGKALFTYFFFQWITMALQSRENNGIENLLSNFVVEGEDSSSLVAEFLKSNFSLIKDKFSWFIILFQQVKVFASPFFSLLAIFTFVLMASWGLKIAGVNSDRLSRKNLFLSSVYAHCFVILSTIPWIGDFAASLIGFIFFMKAMVVQSGEPPLRVFLFTYVFNWLLLSVFFLALGLIVFVVFFSTIKSFTG
jgi:hypothetical protein